MAAFDRLKNASFASIAYPVKRVRVSGGLRDHVHEYPHVDGGDGEKLGRKLYEITMECVFLEGLVNPAWANLWPAGLALLRGLWEAGTTADLHIPTIGTIKAYAIDWSQEMDARIRSGEMVEIKFREDKSQAFLIQSLVTVSPTAIADAAAAFEVAAKEIDPQPSLFDGINAAANGILAFKDQVDLAGNLLEAKILGLVDLLEQADAQVQDLNKPQFVRVLDALHDLWAAAQQLHDDVQAKGAQIRQYTVPARTTIADVARAVFGDSSKAAEILQLNPIENPFSIPPGAVLRYYDLAA